MRILLIHDKGLSGTGSATYAGVLIDALEKRHDVKSYSGSADLDDNWDIVHVLDIKHFDSSLVNSIKSKLVVDVHDAHWAPGEPFYPVPDWPLRKYLAIKRRKRRIPVLNGADAIITHSKYVASRLTQWQTHIVPYAVGDTSLSGDIQPDKNIGNNVPADRKERPAIKTSFKKRPPHVIFAGRDFFRKGITVARKAWRHVKLHRPGARLYIAGREYFHGRIYAEWMARDKTITLLGDIERDELIRRISDARAVVLPSWTESFGIVLLEAMSMGTPVVATNTGGIPEALGGGAGGLLVEPGDHRALAKAILKLLDDGEDLSGMIENGKKIAAFYSVESMTRAVEAVYKKVV